MLVCALPVHIAREIAGAARIRHSLRPLTTEGERYIQTSGALRRGNAKMCLPSGCLTFESTPPPAETAGAAYATCQALRLCHLGREPVPPRTMSGSVTPFAD